MKQMKRLALFVLLTVAGTHQLPAEILAQGNPPLTRQLADQITDMFAWVLNGTFTPGQRSEFQDRLAATWQSSEQSAIDGYMAMVNARPKLAQMPAGEREQTRRQLENTIVSSLRQQSNDPLARLLLAVHDHTAGGQEPRVMNAAMPVAAGGVPPALVGTWGTGTVSGVGFRNTATGSVTNGGGTQVQYKFLPGGRYEYAAVTTQNMYSCSSEFMTFKTGIVNIQGDVLTFIPQTSKFTSRDNCSARRNYEKPAGMERETYHWRVERDEYGAKMCLKNEKINGCAYKR
jgi:hypothetical protein